MPMFACLHSPGGNADRLAELASRFSPSIEVSDPETVVFAVDGLSQLIGPPDRIAAAIAHDGAQLGVHANLAIASNPDAAVQAARHYRGVTLIPPGQEAARLGVLPLAQLPMPPEMQDTLARWGVRTFSEFAALPPLGILERFGVEGLELQDLARGAAHRPLVIARDAERYEKTTALEDPLDNLQPLLFIVNGMLADLCKEMSGHGVAANELRLRFEFDNRVPPQERVLALPVPMRDPVPMLKLLQLHLEANPPQAEVTSVSLLMTPVEPRQAQSGLFHPQAPESVRLQITLARIGALVGASNVGSVELLDTHQPDAFAMHPFSAKETASHEPSHEPSRDRKGAVRLSARLSLRLFRPPLPARVLHDHGQLRRIHAPGISGNVTASAGPWRSSGDWWTTTVWARDEWDVSLTDGGLYRVYRQPIDAWFIAGVYD